MRFLTVLFLTVFCFVQTEAATIRVPADFPTIQAGINAASEGDTVTVWPGTYTGDGNRDLTFNGVNITLQSLRGATATIIDCQANASDMHTGILLDNGEDSTSIIDGFTITNAYYEQYGYRGGAIYFINGAANILNCIIKNSEANGIYIEFGIDSASYRISNCIIENNKNGILTGKPGTIIENCKIKNNLYAGIEFWQTTHIKNCLVVRNGWAGITKSGGMWMPLALIENCTIAFNSIGFVYDITFPKLNSELLDVDTTTIKNSLIAYNSIGGIMNMDHAEGEYNCIFSNVYGNGQYNWQNDKYSHDDAFGNLSLNPLFCDTTDNNLFLTEQSPCAAVNNASGFTIGVNDVGCGCCVGIRGNVDGDPSDQVDISDLVLLIECIFFADLCTVCDEEVDVNASGGYYDISDLVYLVDFIFTGGPEPEPCN